jgi:DNA-binding beta-propeller fold protein YncE
VITRDGRYLLAADGPGAAVLSVSAAEHGRSHAVLGNLSVPTSAGRLNGAIEAAVTPDGRFAFVSFEGSAKIGVWNLAAALADGFDPSSYVGAIPTDVAPVGMAVSPDGRWLYATSEIVRGHDLRGEGSLRVVDLRTAETDPARSVLARVTAGCSPVRVAVSPDGSAVWVTARESDALLGFSSDKLRSDPRHALEADVRVGEAPVGLAVLDGGRRVVVCDSNRFLRKGSHSGLTVVDTAAAVARRSAVLGEIAAGGFPRDASADAAGRELLVANFQSGQLETVPLSAVP